MWPPCQQIKLSPRQSHIRVSFPRTSRTFTSVLKDLCRVVPQHSPSCCHCAVLSFILAGFTGDCRAITLLRPVASKLYCKEHSEYEDSGLHKAGPAEGCPAQTQRERYVDPRRRLLRSQRAGRLCSGRSTAS